METFELRVALVTNVKQQRRLKTENRKFLFHFMCLLILLFYLFIYFFRFILPSACVPFHCYYYFLRFFHNLFLHCMPSSNSNCYSKILFSVYFTVSIYFLAAAIVIAQRNANFKSNAAKEGVCCMHTYTCICAYVCVCVKDSKQL